MRGSASLFPMRRRGRQAWLISRAQSILDNMHCPFCQNPDTKVVDTRISDDGHSIRRRRECPKCSKRFTTLETTMLLVVKRSGNVEQFDRNKVISGVRKACQGRPINEDDLKMLGRRSRRIFVHEDWPKSNLMRSARRFSSRCVTWTWWRTCASPASTRISRIWRTSKGPSTS